MANFYTNVRSYGNDILYVGYNDKGERVQKRIDFKPEFFIRDNTGGPVTHSSYDGTPLKRMPFDSIKDSKEFVETYKDVTDFPVFGHLKPPVQLISKLFSGDIKYNLNYIRIFYLDIEVMSDQGFPEPEEAERPITVISVYDSKTKKTHSWGVKEYHNTDPNVVWHQFSIQTEAEMLVDFVSFWSMNYPDIITGWHSRGFDIPYLINRIRNICGNAVANRLSPWNKIQQKSVRTQKFSTSEDEINYDIYGIADLDYMDLYKKYSLSQSESYKLDFIAKEELNDQKLEYDGSLHELYVKDYKRYVEYNIHDVNLVKKLEDKKRFLALIIEVSYIGHVPSYTDSLGTVSYWEYLIYSYLYSKNIIPPIKKRENNNRDYQYVGAFVKDPIVGLHRWVVSFDLTSLYPSTIRQLNIGPETFVGICPGFSNITLEDLLAKRFDTGVAKAQGYSIGANGAMYRKDKKSFISELVGEIFNLRKKYKKQMIELQKKYEETKDESLKAEADILDIKQHACKILINAAYGAIGNQYFQYYSIENAEAVTKTGQLIIRWTQDKLNEYLNSLLKTTNVDYIIASDTDSVYINLGPLVEKMFPNGGDTTKIANFVDNFCEKKISPFIDGLYADLFEYTNGYENLMSMKREIIADSAIWTAKKRYAANVLDSEGVRYKEPELKVKGLEIVKSSTPAVCRDALEDCVKLVLTGSEKDFISYISSFKNKFGSLSAKQIAFPRGVTDIDKYQTATKGVPMHVRGALNYNKLLLSKDLDTRYELIKNGSKVKYIPLKTPNPIYDDVLAFVDNLPKEFNLDSYIDYETQFDKSFLQPIKVIADLAGWKTEQTDTYDDLFG